MKKSAYAAVAVLIILLLIGAFSGGFLYSTFVHQTIPKPAKGFDFSLLKEVLSDIEKNYYENPSKSKLLEGAIDGIIKALNNPYAVYYSPQEYKLFKNEMSGTYNYSGIGVTIGGKPGKIKVLQVFADSPAAAKNLRKGDMVLAINGKSTKKMEVDQAVKLIRGLAGTKVRLTLQSAHRKRTVVLVRREIAYKYSKIKTQTFKDTGYIWMHSFTSDIAEELKRELVKFQKKGINKLIFDLRENPGGQLSEAVDVASLFIDKGVIVRIKNRGKQETTYSATGGKIYDGRLVVLINENSASASEIVAGAIQDRHRGQVAGVRSFGKGTVQQVIPLSNGGALLIPNEIWMTPNGNHISKGKGITPDVKVELKENGADSQLARARSLLK